MFIIYDRGMCSGLGENCCQSKTSIKFILKCTPQAQYFQSVYIVYRRDKIILSFPVTFLDFSGSVGRKKKFLTGKNFTSYYHFCWKLPENFLSRGFLPWVGRVTGNYNIILSRHMSTACILFPSAEVINSNAPNYLNLWEWGLFCNYLKKLILLMEY